MRYLILTAAAVAALGLAGCGKSVSEAAADQAPAPKKSLARMAPMYAGQEDIQALTTAEAVPGKDGAVLMKAEGVETGKGWTEAGFLPRIYAAAPADGIYEVDVVAQKPATADSTPTPVEVKGDWDKYKDGRVKGIKFISKTNSVVAMLPAGGGTAAGK
jgi:hypothetical protein